MRRSEKPFGGVRTEKRKPLRVLPGHMPKRGIEVSAQETERERAVFFRFSQKRSFLEKRVDNGGLPDV